jgi:FkbM family methyltransferase
MWTGGKMPNNNVANLAAGRPALQSSICEWSLGTTVQDDASIPVSPNPPPKAYCHTAFEREPWWEVDLGQDAQIQEVQICNRADEPQRLRQFAVFLAFSDSPGKWFEIFRKTSETPLPANEPYVVRPDWACAGRYVRIQLLGEGFLHFRQCQVIGKAADRATVTRIQKQMVERSERAIRKQRDLKEELRSGRNGQICTIGAHEVFADSDNYSPTLIRAITGGGYELRERQLIPKLLRPGDRVLEVGTAIGVVSMAAAAIVGPEAVATYDANPAIVADAKRNFKANGLGRISANVGILRNRAAWSSSETELDFHISRDFWASRLDPGPTTEDIVQIVKVPLVPLEDAIARHRANVLICDIEGGEVDLLTGADLSSIRAILMETHYWSAGRRQIDEMVRYLVGAGFDINLDLVGDHVMVLDRADA